MSVARVWALPGLGGMGGLRAEFAAGTQTPHPSHRKKQALPAVHPNSKPCIHVDHEMSIALSAGQNILELLDERLPPLRVGPAEQLLGLLPGQGGAEPRGSSRGSTPTRTA